MSSELKNLQDDRDALKAAIRSGITSVSVAGQTTTFGSLKDMRSVLADVEREIAAMLNQAADRPRVSSFNLSRGV